MSFRSANRAFEPLCPHLQSRQGVGAVGCASRVNFLFNHARFTPDTSILHQGERDLDIERERELVTDRPRDLDREPRDAEWLREIRRRLRAGSSTDLERDLDLERECELLRLPGRLSRLWLRPGERLRPLDELESLSDSLPLEELESESELELELHTGERVSVGSTRTAASEHTCSRSLRACVHSPFAPKSGPPYRCRLQ